MDQVTAGFLPLTDSAILVAARERGFAEAEGIDLVLVRETSWASIRDRMAVGHFDCAHMLAPMPVAANLGLTPLPLRLVAPMALGLGGNAVTVSNALAEAMAAAGFGGGIDPACAGQAIGAVCEARRRAGQPALQFAVVHPHSAHNFDLRYWLAACGIDPDKDVSIVIVPPPLMADALAAGTIDGYCVGEPWNSVAVDAGTGTIVTAKSQVWRASPEKVLGVRADWADARPDLADRLVRALYRAAEWCGHKDNAGELAAILAGKSYLASKPALIERALTGRLMLGGGAAAQIADFFLPFARAATFPWQSHALWFYSQMVRWGQTGHAPQSARIAATSYRPDIYRRALCTTAAPIPSASSKVEGALAHTTAVGASKGVIELGPDGFFDGRVFDPDQLDAYLASQSVWLKGG